MVDLGVELGQILAIGDADVGGGVEGDDAGAIALILAIEKTEEIR